MENVKNISNACMTLVDPTNKSNSHSHVGCLDFFLGGLGPVGDAVGRLRDHSSGGAEREGQRREGIVGFAAAVNLPQKKIMIKKSRVKFALRQKKKNSFHNGAVKAECDAQVSVVLDSCVTEIQLSLK